MPPKRKVSSSTKPSFKKTFLNESPPSRAQNIFSARILSKSDEMAFEEADFNLCAHNEFGRYALPNSKEIAHALVFEKPDGTLWAEQYQIQDPVTLSSYSSTVCKLTDIQKIDSPASSSPIFVAKNDAGKTFIGKRTHHRIDRIKETSTSETYSERIMDVVYFSENEDDEQDEFFSTASSGADPKKFFDQTASRKAEAALRKGGIRVKLNHRDILEREKSTNRGISQNRVMGEAKPELKIKDWSAVKECEAHAQKHQKELSQAFFDHLMRSAKANIWKHAESQERYEWLHAYGFTLAPKDRDPQVAENLGAAPKWANTEMMVLERIAKWFTLTLKDQGETSIRAIFSMLPHSEIIRKIHYELQINHENYQTYFVEDIYPLQEYPLLHKASDLAQSIGILHAQMTHEAPISTSMVTSVKREVRSRIQQPIPENLPKMLSETSGLKTLTIIDLETTGLDHTENEIIEIGILSVAFDSNMRVVGLKHQYNALSEPRALPEKIIEITGLTFEMLQGKTIDWDHVLTILNDTDYVVCHNSNFDRKFLESATPEHISAKIRTMPFGCTMDGINWDKRGFLSKKLIELNAKLGFVYPAHRALNDCWATLNLLRQLPSTLKELINDIETSKSLIFLTTVPEDRVPQLKATSFYYSGTQNKDLPQGWYKYIRKGELPQTKKWLDECIFQQEQYSTKLPAIHDIDATDMYSVRALFQRSAIQHQINRLFKGHGAAKITDASKSSATLAPR